jgi:E3 ubiquitin-protein ligase synoviolin
VVFFGIVVHYYGVPLHIVRDVYMTLRSFLQKCRDLVRYRQATANMQERYPTATPDELGTTDGICIVCREQMILTGTQGNPQPIPETPKKLPCGHIFHFRCLRGWLERQQACPTCRRSVLEQNNDAHRIEPNANPAQGIAHPLAIPGLNVDPPPAQPADVPIPTQTAPNEAVPIPNSATGLANSQATTANQSSVLYPAVVYPITLTPIGPVTTLNEPTAIPSDLEMLSNEKLQNLEGNSREQIIARLERLQRIENQIRVISTELKQLLHVTPVAYDRKQKSPE